MSTNVLVSFTRPLTLRIEVIVPEKYLLKGFLEVAYNAAIVLKNLEQRPKIKSYHDEKTGIGTDRINAALYGKGIFPRKIDLSIKSDSNLDFQQYGMYQILFSKYVMPSRHCLPF